jgi:hypothetical protein
MNHASDQVQQSLIHVLDEWAKTGHLWDERIFPHRLAQQERSGRADLHRAHDDYWSGPRHATSLEHLGSGVPTQIDGRFYEGVLNGTAKALREHPGNIVALRYRTAAFAPDIWMKLAGRLTNCWRRTQR